MSVLTSTKTPNAMLIRLERMSQPRPLIAGPRIAAMSPTTPLAAVNAPKTIASANRLMPGQMRMTTASAIERTPLIPSAHRTRFSSVPANCPALSTIESIDEPPGRCVRLDCRAAGSDRESESTLTPCGNPAARPRGYLRPKRTYGRANPTVAGFAQRVSDLADCADVRADPTGRDAAALRWNPGAALPDRHCRDHRRQLRGLALLRAAESALSRVPRLLLPLHGHPRVPRP